MKYLLLTICSLIFCGSSAQLSDYLELKQCKILNITYHPTNGWAYDLLFLTDSNYDSIDVNLSTATTLAESLDAQLITLRMPMISYLEPYKNLSSKNNFKAASDSIALYICDCQTKIYDNSNKYTITTLDGSIIECSVIEVIGVFFIEKNKTIDNDGKPEAILVSLITCLESKRIHFSNQE